MNFTFNGSGQPHSFDFSLALGLAQRAHNAALASPGADVFSQLRLDRTSIAQELSLIASAPAVKPGYTSVPNWKIWQDF